MTVSSTLNLAHDSEAYTHRAYLRVLEFGTREVSMGNWRLDDIETDFWAVMRNWESENYGKIDVSDDGYSMITVFHLNDRGFNRGKELEAKYQRRKYFRKIADAISGPIQGCAVWIAAVAAVAAAYFSYLGLQRP